MQRSCIAICHCFVATQNTLLSLHKPRESHLHRDVSRTRFNNSLRAGSNWTPPPPSAPPTITTDTATAIPTTSPFPLNVPIAEFNFHPPVIHDDGRITIEHNFPKTGPINKALAIARNSEVHPLLKEAGHITQEENDQIRMHHCQSKQKVYIGARGDEQFEGCWLDEAAICELPSTYAQMVELGELCLRRAQASLREETHSYFRKPHDSSRCKCPQFSRDNLNIKIANFSIF
jgi:hypothetical protein